MTELPEICYTGTMTTSQQDPAELEFRAKHSYTSAHIGRPSFIPWHELSAEQQESWREDVRRKD